MLGLGLDIVDVASFEAQLGDPASSFVERTFTAAERRTAAARPGGRPGRHLAVRFAAKEALIKAWSSANYGGAPMVPHPNLHEIEVINDLHHRPALRVTGEVARAMENLLGPHRNHLSLSHDGGYAAAVVVIEPA